MEELFAKYEFLKVYPEFDSQTIEKKYSSFVVNSKTTGEGEMESPSFLFNTTTAFKYVILMYAPESEFSAIEDTIVRKKWSMDKAGVSTADAELIASNQNPMISDMITRFFRVTSGFDFELLESAREAVAILLEVVRTPVSKELEDDKARNAIKAKAECYKDAQFLITEIKKLQKELGDKGVDVADNITKTAFKAGMAETLVSKQRKT